MGLMMANVEKEMGANEYQKLAARTINQELSTVQKVQHARDGIASEYGEIAGLFQKTYQGHMLDATHLKKEVGDMLWFVAEFCTAMNWRLADVMRLNIEKLEKRYPNGFEAERSLNRAEGDI